jgi:hypothetical protein
VDVGVARQGYRAPSHGAASLPANAFATSSNCKYTPFNLYKIINIDVMIQKMV